ncbi:hypothetical protein AOLI_G00199970 [Acnodon oligacanthus]
MIAVVCRRAIRTTSNILHQTGRYGQKKLSFCPSTVIFKTSRVGVSSDLDTLCHHAICPPSKPYEEPASAGDYYTLDRDDIRLSATHL